MTRVSIIVATLVLVVEASAADDATSNALKNAVVSSVDNQSAALVEMSDRIWAHAEIALHETQSGQVLADYAEQQGFRVERGIAGMPMAFIASYGKGKPIIGVLGEYDALPGLSQSATPTRNVLTEGAAGHGCGHNLFGVGSLGAATAIKELMESGKLEGTLRYYGTPAEESIGGKIYMAREGLFDDLDIALSWHPNSSNEMDTSSSQAMVETLVDFEGSAAHAAFDPWNGRSALDGLELFTHALNMLREHVRPTVRIHYAIHHGGDAPNVVPAKAQVGVWIRDSEMDGVLPLYERMQVMAKGAAMAANVEAEVRLLSATYNTLINNEAAKIVHANMKWLGDVEFSASENEFARQLQKEMGVPELGMDGTVQPLVQNSTDASGGSTDVADVSWLVPTVDVEIATAPVDIPWHSWGVVAASGSSMGHRGMQYAAKVLATTMIDLYTSPELLGPIRNEFDERTEGFTYKAYIPDGPPPIPAGL
jgi:aminobenzoyl-glutamate utilization protein B